MHAMLTRSTMILAIELSHGTEELQQQPGQAGGCALYVRNFLQVEFYIEIFNYPVICLALTEGSFPVT